MTLARRQPLLGAPAVGGLRARRTPRRGGTPNFVQRSHPDVEPSIFAVEPAHTVLARESFGRIGLVCVLQNQLSQVVGVDGLEPAQPRNLGKLTTDIGQDVVVRVFQMSIAAAYAYHPRYALQR